MSIGSSLSTSVGLLLGVGFLNLARRGDWDRRGDCERSAATSSLAVLENRELTKLPKAVVVAGVGGSGLWLVGEASACSERSGFDWLACHIARKGDAMILSNKYYLHGVTSDYSYGIS